MGSSLIFMEPCQGPATCSGPLMKIGWAASEILWLQVGIGAVLKVNGPVVFHLRSPRDATTASIAPGRWKNVREEALRER